MASALNVPNVTVASATMVAPTTITLPAGTFTVPAYCQVIGAVETNGDCPATGPFAAPSGPNLIGCNTPGSAKFRLKLPLVWNNHFLFEGCGGNCGSVNSTSVNPVDNAEALGLGYAVVNTNTGHDQDPTTVDLTWAVSQSTPPLVNNSAIIDFYYRAVHQVTVATKQYVQAYYSAPIDVAYFDGCSTGGRQSMMEGTRYPVDYDGLVVGDPAIGVPHWQDLDFQAGQGLHPNRHIYPARDGGTGRRGGEGELRCRRRRDGWAHPELRRVLVQYFVTRAQRLDCSTGGCTAKLHLAGDRIRRDCPSFPACRSVISALLASLTNAELTTPPIDPTAAEPWGARPTGGGFGPAAWSLGEGGIKTYVVRESTL